MKKAFVKTLVKLMEKNNNIYVLTGDLGYGVMNPILEKFPERFINLGICEQNMASVAAGLALEDNIVYMYSIANFPTLRCLEQIRNDIIYNMANVKIISVGSGFSYGSLGMSHHATEDIGIMRTLPKIEILSPADKNETIEAVKYANEVNGPVYVRIGRGGEEDICHLETEISKGLLKIKEGKEILIFTTGTILKEAYLAAKILEEENIHVGVYAIPILKPFNEERLKKICSDAKLVFSVEEHNIIGGLGSTIAEILASVKNDIIYKRIGLNDTFVDVVGSPEYISEFYQLDSKGIASKIRNVVNCFFKKGYSV